MEILEHVMTSWPVMQQTSKRVHGSERVKINYIKILNPTLSVSQRPLNQVYTLQLTPDTSINAKIKRWYAIMREQWRVVISHKDKFWVTTSNVYPLSHKTGPEMLFLLEMWKAVNFFYSQAIQIQIHRIVKAEFLQQVFSSFLYSVDLKSHTLQQGKGKVKAALIERHLGNMILVSIASLTCQHTRVRCWPTAHLAAIPFPASEKVR